MGEESMRILVFSHKPEVRESIINAIGRRPAADLSRVEITDCPPIVVSVRRKDDRWLATWSQADAVLVHPLDPLTAAETVADVLRARRVPVVNG